jgi:protease-4
MRTAAVLPVLALVPLGCCRPLRTESVLHHTQETPVEGRLTVENHTYNPVPEDAGPVLEMPLGCAGPCEEGPRVAIVDVDGLLLDQNMTGPLSWGENPVAVFREKLDKAAASPAVCAVVLRINSPGGGVTATDMMWQELRAFRARTRRPVVACLLDLGTGGAYYLATAADLIVALPTTVTGGIGVIWNSYNLRDLMAQQNVFPQPIKAGENIDMGTTAGALTPAARALLQKMADEFHERFRRVVREARPGLRDPRETFDGRVFTATEALGRGLIDRIGYLEDALALARDLAHQDQARAVLLHRRLDPSRSPYGVTPNTPLQPGLFPVSIPGIDRSRLPTFLYVWQPEPTLEKLGGR